jgi:hypothetical protein
MLPPRLITVAMIATAMAPAMSPYSIVVTLDRFLAMRPSQSVAAALTLSAAI